jgi:hypothetical protein
VEHHEGRRGQVYRCVAGAGDSYQGTASGVQSGARNESCLQALLIRILIAPLPIPNREHSAENHYSNRRQQQHQHGLIQRLLALLRRGLGIRIAHRAALTESRRCPERTRQQKDCERITQKCHDCCPIPTPFGGGWTRSASGKKKKYIITKHAVTAITSIQRMIAFSNFRCMK